MLNLKIKTGRIETNCNLQKRYIMESGEEIHLSVNVAKSHSYPQAEKIARAYIESNFGRVKKVKF